jgi:hypothetical protein
MENKKVILFTLIAVIVSDALVYISWSYTININSSTYIILILDYISIFVLIAFAYKSNWNEIPQIIKSLYRLWIFWNIFNFIRGMFVAGDYWDWKFLLMSSFSFTMIPLTFFYGKNLQIVKAIFRFVLKIIFLLGFFIIPLALITYSELYSRLMIPVSLFILFIPYIKYKWKLLILIVSVTSVAICIDFRTNFIKIAFSLILLLIYFFWKKLNLNWFRLAHLILFVLPLVFFILAVSGNYSLFEEFSQKQSIELNAKQQKNAFSDTRTFLYVEVLQSLNQTGHWILGESASGTYRSSWFTDPEGNGRRWNCEVGILNILLHNGIIGCLIYFLLLFTVSRIAITSSNNSLTKYLGLFIAFRWVMSFLEEYTQFDLNFFFFWLTIGLVSNASFRQMNDNEIKDFFGFI